MDRQKMAAIVPDIMAGDTTIIPTMTTNTKTGGKKIK